MAVPAEAVTAVDFRLQRGQAVAGFHLLAVMPWRASTGVRHAAALLRGAQADPGPPAPVGAAAAARSSSRPRTVAVLITRAAVVPVQVQAAILQPGGDFMLVQPGIAGAAQAADGALLRIPDAATDLSDLSQIIQRHHRRRQPSPGARAASHPSCHCFSHPRLMPWRGTASICALMAGSCAARASLPTRSGVGRAAAEPADRAAQVQAVEIRAAMAEDIDQHIRAPGPRRERSRQRCQQQFVELDAADAGGFLQALRSARHRSRWRWTAHGFPGWRPADDPRENRLPRRRGSADKPRGLALPPCGVSRPARRTCQGLQVFRERLVRGSPRRQQACQVGAGIGLRPSP